MKKLLNLFSVPCLILAILLVTANTLSAQEIKEASQDLSKSAHKGMLTNALLDNNGDIVLTYSMKVDKKSDQLSYEAYVFDKDLNFKGVQPGKENKEIHPEKKVTYLAAYAGGTNSFNILSQKLFLQREERLMTWDYKRQRYQTSKVLSRNKVSLKNSESRYDGYTELSTEEGAFIIASYKPDTKGAGEQFVALAIDANLNVKETPITTDGDYSLVYYGIRESGNPFVIMAPKKKMPDTKKYVFAEFTPKAELVKRTTISSPSPNLMVMDHRDLNGDLYLVGTSTKSSNAYESEFTDYANISNPGMGVSWQGQKYAKEVYKEEMDNFHFLKLKDGELLFASTTPVKNFDDKVITPPGQKKKHVYKGKKLFIETLAVTPSGEYLLSGQLMDNDIVKQELVTKYKDFVGLYFSATGELKAQYAVEKMNNDSKSEIFNSEQEFIVSPDGKTAYWKILEVKGVRGYASIWDAINNNETWMANYFPRIAKIDLTSGSLSDFTIMGDKGKFLIFKDYPYVINKKTNTIYFIGHDDDYEKLWLGKYQL
jgi:hypothetical protein